MASASKGFQSLQDTDSERIALFREVVDNYIAEGSRSTLSLVVVGQSGQGKSTLINGLMGQQIATEGDDFDSCTAKLDHYQFRKHGVHVDIWDTPGFGVWPAKEDEKTMEEMERDIEQIDLVLYCSRMDTKTWPVRADTETIEGLTKIFSKDVWSRCLFVLTFANRVAEHIRLEHDKDTVDEVFSRRCNDWEERFNKKIRELAGLTHADEIYCRAVPVGLSVSKKPWENPWKLPDREDWFSSFWIDVTEQMRDNAVPAILQLNRHRLASHEPHDRDQDSVNPTVESDEIHTRPVHRRAANEGVDQNIRDESVEGLGASVENGHPKQFPERDIPSDEILRNKLDKEGSGFLKFAREFAKLRGHKYPAIGHVGGFIEGLWEYLGSSKRKKMAQGQR